MKCTLCNAQLTLKKNAFFYTCATFKAIVKDRKYYLTAKEEKAIYKNHNNDVNDVRYQNIGDDFCSYLDEYKAGSYKKLENVIYDNMFSFIIKHKSQVKKDYENGKDNQDFIDDMVTYLMSNCGMYYKSTMYSLSNGAE